ncbi:hypothetical protein BDV96DRAFT_405120 [Lophiotrema nucula]|uniref:Zn(2)-C6 fungal-type domain-containing protein n=1 Tax=Lophiotrema nucula TaxID=690887 RepID=A0A6A5ZEC6_9PLEO|nr:hypothetical protein BDV96DRAFT_405120 [Lophiotrema nucula]
MPSVVQTAVINSSAPYMLKERPQEPVVSAFTAVNGRTSPPSYLGPNGVHGVTTESQAVRPVTNSHQALDRAPSSSNLPSRNGWAPAPRVIENGYQNRHHQSGSVSPPLSSTQGSPTSPGKRKRSGSSEESSSDTSQDGTDSQGHPRLDSYEYHSSNHTGRAQTAPMDSQQQQQRTLPPIERPGNERGWTQQPQDARSNAYPEQHYQDARAMEHTHNIINGNPAQASQATSQPDTQDSMELSTIETTRAGAQVDPKRRKRQFANRTKTGCGTCRRRKKKCDEGKPECNNCTRGGFICEGYANKIPWPKNGVTKPQPLLQAKDQYPTQLYHNHGTNREAYPEQPAQPSVDGGRGRPIVVEEHERRNGWGQWGQHPQQPALPAEQQQRQSTEYNHPPAMGPQAGPVATDQQVPLTPQSAQQRQHNPRIYHHTPQTMSHVVNNTPAVTDGPMYHNSQHPHQAQHIHPPPQTSAQGPPPPPMRYTGPPPQNPQKSEKEKMLNYEPFLPYTQTLEGERQRCRSLCYRFNNYPNPEMKISKEELERHLRGIFLPPGVRYPRSSDLLAHVGVDVSVNPPFNCDYGYNVTIGDRVVIGANAKFLDSGRIIIGRNTTIGANVTIDTIKVPTNPKEVKGTHGSVTAAEITIGDNVYIGANVTICAGVKIGTGAIIHPGSVVVRDVPRDVSVKGPSAEVRSVYYDQE